ncbi:MAG: hypothetical protein K6T83_08650 [Alicyclobacillus sp.]|nr:hypothetical protein [Alicyclobacillus sp.]
MRLWLAQTFPELGNVDANIVATQEIIDRVADEQEAGIVVFPELSLTGYWLREAWPLHGLSVYDLGTRIQCPYRLTAIIGMAERTSEGLFNSAARIDGQRGVNIVHRKIYPVSYPPFDESKYFRRGRFLRPITIDAFRIAILICNDAWHPSLPYLAALQGVNLLIIQANSAIFGRNEIYWTQLVHHYATIYGMYVAFVNRVGTENGWTFWGGSSVVSPLGEVILRAGAEEGIYSAELSLDEVEFAQEQLPIAQEEDPELLYRELGSLLKRSSHSNAAGTSS